MYVIINVNYNEFIENVKIVREKENAEIEDVEEMMEYVINIIVKKQTYVDNGMIIKYPSTIDNNRTLLLLVIGTHSPYK